MKFPDDTSLMRHIGLKKLCLERHNMGHADPTIVHRGQSTSGSAAEEGVISAISFQSARKNDDLPPRSQDNSGYLNSYVTYAFPHNSNMTSTSHPMSSQKESGLLHSSSIDQWLDEEEDNGAQFSNYNTGGSSDEQESRSRAGERDTESSLDDDESWLPGGSSSEELSSSDEEEENDVNVEAARESLKSIADIMRRRKMSTFHLPTDVQMVMDLYQRIVGNGGSLKTYDAVLEWAFNHSLIGDHIPRRKPMLKLVSEAVYGNEFLKIAHPKQRRVPLCTGRVAEVTIFDIRTILVDLLCNEDLMQRENLVFGDSDFTDVNAGVPNNDEYDDVNSGAWWRDTVLKIKEDYPHLQDKSVLWPLIFFIDGVSHGEFTNLSQEPVLLTFSAFKRSVRNKPQAWRPLAYIDFKGNLKGKVSPYLAINEYHQVLGEVFNTLSHIQRTGMNWTLSLPGEQQKEVVFFFPIQFIIGDCEGHDKLCGRFSSHNNTPGLVRDCDVPTANGDDPHHHCHFYTREEMEAFTEDELNARSFHHIFHPCHRNLDFGHTAQGVYGALLPEKTHVFDMGSSKEVGDLFTGSLSTASITRTDDVLSYMILHSRIPPSLKFPTISPYRSGLEKVRKLKASERIGKIFALYAILMSSHYVQFLYDHPKAGEDKEVAFGDLKQQMKVLERMLCFNDWLASKKHAKHNIDPDEDGNESISLQKIRDLMIGIKIYFPRRQGMQWKITKFHQLLHFPHNISRHGSAMNFDGGRPEYYGKHFCKDLTTRTQRRQISLGKQTAQRYFEIATVMEAERILAHHNTLSYRDNGKYQYLHTGRDANEDEPHDNNGNGGYRMKATLCTLSLDPDDDRRLVYKWPNKAYSRIDGFRIDNEAYTKVASRVWNSKNGGRLHRDGKLQCFSECVLPNGETIRSHPFYNSEKPWYDWVLVQWDDYADPLPAKVLLLFEIQSGPIENFNMVGDSRIPHIDNYLEIGAKYAVVQTVTGNDFNYRGRRFHLKSHLAVRYTLERHLRLIEIDSIERLTFVVMNDIGNLGNDDNADEEPGSIIMFKDRSIWKDLFLEL
jgi:hypothetical protein